MERKQRLSERLLASESLVAERRSSRGRSRSPKRSEGDASSERGADEAEEESAATEAPVAPPPGQGHDPAAFPEKQ